MFPHLMALDSAAIALSQMNDWENYTSFILHQYGIFNLTDDEYEELVNLIYRYRGGM